MKKTLQRLVVILLAIAMLLTVLLPAVSIFAYASKVTKDDIEALEGQLDDIAERKREVQGRLASIRNDLAQAKEAVSLVNEQILLTEQQIAATQDLIDATQDQIDATQAQIEESQRQIDASQALLNQYDADIAAKEAEIADLEEQEQEQLEEYYAQVRWMDEHGAISYLSILFEASSFSELLDYITVIGDLIDYNDRVVTQLRDTQDALARAKAQVQVMRDDEAEVHAQLEDQKAIQEEQKAQLESQQAAQEAQKTQLEGQKTQLEKDRAEAAALMDEIAAQESQVAQEAKAIANDEAALQRALKDAEKKYAEQLAALEQQNNVNSGEWYWPLPGKYGLTSLFGGRYHPITGRWSSHTGTDIGNAPTGTKIYAAKAGVVSFAGWDNSYGWYVMISHGNGYTTLYAHQCQKPPVTTGQSVSKGQLIGYVGSTGSSTAPHLHFELRINGARNDVLRLYPNTKFTARYGGKLYSWYGNNYPEELRGSGR